MFQNLLRVEVPLQEDRAWVRRKWRQQISKGEFQSLDVFSEESMEGRVATPGKIFKDTGNVEHVSHLKDVQDTEDQTRSVPSRYAQKKEAKDLVF